MKNPVVLATITAPHGVRGEVRVRAHTAHPLSIGDYGPLYSQNGKPFKITTMHQAKNVLVVRFKGIDSREAAENLHNLNLYVERACLPDDLADDEFYVGDLIGMAVQNLDGTDVGTIVAVPDFGAGHLIEIAPLQNNGAAGKTTWFLEFSGRNVPHLDMQNCRVTIDPPAEVSERDNDGATADD